MEKMIGSCGLVCTECPAYIATLNNDDEKRKETAKMWGEMYNADIQSESINCKGCQQNELVFSHCNECKIRACAQGKDYKTCAECSDYTCEELEGLLKYAPEARDVLNNLR